MLRTILGGLLLAISLGALADGVPLITAGPALSANDPARQLRATADPAFVKLHPISLNKSGFGANVLTVVIEGKEYRFAGALMPILAPAKGAPKQRDSRGWSGKELGGGTIVLTRDTDTGTVFGEIFLPPSRTFRIAYAGGSVVLVEVDANIVAPLVYAPISSAPGSGR